MADNSAAPCAESAADGEQRPATLAQAISSTRSVAAASIRSASRKGRPRSSRNEFTRVLERDVRRPTADAAQPRHGRGSCRTSVAACSVREDPAELRCCAQQWEERGAHPCCGKVGRPVRPVEHDGDLRVGGELFERPRVIP